MKDMRNDTDLPVSFDELVSELSDLGDKKRAIGEATAALRARLKAILDQRGYHKKAMAVIRDIDDMSETMRADFLRSFVPMFMVMYEGRWEEAQRDMLDQTGDGEE